MLETIIDGYFTEEQCKRIKEKMSGKTYFEFDIQWSNLHSNCCLIVRSHAVEHTQEELRNMFIHTCICELAR